LHHHWHSTWRIPPRNNFRGMIYRRASLGKPASFSATTESAKPSNLTRCNPSKTSVLAQRSRQERRIMRAPVPVRRMLGHGPQAEGFISSCHIACAGPGGDGAAYSSNYCTCVRAYVRQGTPRTQVLWPGKEEIRTSYS
jgi:hypothetical protein